MVRIGIRSYIRLDRIYPCRSFSVVVASYSYSYILQCSNVTAHNQWNAVKNVKLSFTSQWFKQKRLSKYTWLFGSWWKETVPISLVFSLSICLDPVSSLKVQPLPHACTNETSPAIAADDTAVRSRDLTNFRQVRLVLPSGRKGNHSFGLTITAEDSHQSAILLLWRKMWQVAS